MGILRTPDSQISIRWLVAASHQRNIFEAKNDNNYRNKKSQAGTNVLHSTGNFAEFMCSKQNPSYVESIQFTHQTAAALLDC